MNSKVSVLDKMYFSVMADYGIFILEAAGSYNPVTASSLSTSRIIGTECSN